MMPMRPSNDAGNVISCSDIPSGVYGMAKATTQTMTAASSSQGIGATQEERPAGGEQEDQAETSVSTDVRNRALRTPQLPRGSRGAAARK